MTAAENQRFFIPTALIGNHDARRALSVAMDAGKLSRSLVLTGPSGSGRRTLALRLATGFALHAQFLPSALDDGPADMHRRLLVQGAHPDIIVIEPEGKKGGVSAAATRQLQGLQSTTAAMGKGKAALIFGAERMNREAANAVLKVLEEPKATMTIILVASQLQALLPTIRSRCAHFAFGTLADRDVEDILAAHGLQLPAEAVAMAQGDANMALALAREGLDLVPVIAALDTCLTGPARVSANQIAPLLGLEKALGASVAQKLLFQRARTLLGLDDPTSCRVGRQDALCLPALQQRFVQRETLSLDSAASWLDVLTQMRAIMVKTNS